MTRRPNDFLQDRLVLPYQHISLTATTSQVVFQPRRDFTIDQVRYVNDTGLAADATDFFAITLQVGAVVLATWSTETGEEGTLTAATFVNLTLSAVAGVLSLDADDEVKIVFTEGGTATLPPGQLQIEGRYIK